jgi:mono/diheme cytochrome c family protein
MNPASRIGLMIVGGALLVGLGTLPFVLRGHDPSKGDPARGKALALQYCARCHAVEPGKQSPVADAPPFYTFAQHWPLEDLEEALAEGIMVGHEKYQMPVFQFEPEQIADLIAYLKTIQVPAQKAPEGPPGGDPAGGAPPALQTPAQAQTSPQNPPADQDH